MAGAERAGTVPSHPVWAERKRQLKPTIEALSRPFRATAIRDPPPARRSGSGFSRAAPALFAPTGNDHEGCVMRRRLGRSDPLNLIYADARAAPSPTPANPVRLSPALARGSRSAPRRSLSRSHFFARQRARGRDGQIPGACEAKVARESAGLRDSAGAQCRPHPADSRHLSHFIRGLVELRPVRLPHRAGGDAGLGLDRVDDRTARDVDAVP